MGFQLFLQTKILFSLNEEEDNKEKDEEKDNKEDDKDNEEDDNNEEKDKDNGTTRMTRTRMAKRRRTTTRTFFFWRFLFSRHWSQKSRPAQYSSKQSFCHARVDVWECTGD